MLEFITNACWAGMMLGIGICSFAVGMLIIVMMFIGVAAIVREVL